MTQFTRVRTLVVLVCALLNSETLTLLSSTARADEPTVTRQLLFTSQGRTGLINSDGTGLKYFDFDVPNQATWQPGPLFSDGQPHCVSEHGAAPRRTGDGRSKSTTRKRRRISGHMIWSAARSKNSARKTASLLLKPRRCSSATTAPRAGREEQGRTDRQHEAGWHRTCATLPSPAKACPMD